MVHLVVQPLVHEHGHEHEYEFESEHEEAYGDGYECCEHQTWVVL